MSLINELTPGQRKEWAFYNSHGFELEKRVFNKYNYRNGKHIKEMAYFAHCKKRGTFLIAENTCKEWLQNAVQYPDDIAQNVPEPKKPVQLDLFNCTFSIS